MLRPKFNSLFPYAFAALTVAAALLATLELRPLIRPSVFIMFVAAVAVAAWRCGPGPSLLATLLSALSVRYFFLTPPHSLANTNLSEIYRLGIFVIVGLLITSLSGSRKKAEESLLEQVRLADFITEVGSVLGESENLLKTMHGCTELMVKHLDAAFARIWMLDQESNVLELVSSAGMYTHTDGGHSRVPVGQLKIGLIALEGKPHLTNQVLDDPRVSNQEWARREGMVAFAGYPLIVNDRLIGVAAMFARQPLTKPVLQALGAAAHRIALTVERRRAEDALKNSMKFNETILDAMQESISIVDVRDFKIVSVNKAFVETLGLDEGEVLGKTCYGVTHHLDVPCSPPDNPCPILTSKGSGQPATFEHVHYDKQGSPSFFEVTASPIRNDKGEIIQAVHVARNITERKKSENALRQSQDELRALAGRLLSAKEEENKRLARELHDSFSQRLAVLGMEAAALQKKLAPQDGSLNSSLEWMQEEIGNLGKDLHQLSRQLHPSIVDDLGLAAALRAECASFSKQHGIEAKLRLDEVPELLPREVSLSLYRIAQESLWNIAKHARAHSVRVVVAQVDGEIVLSVDDNGMGFDPNQTKGRGSLGLVSMEERARLVRGSFAIQSQPGKGTKVEVRIPLPAAGMAFSSEGS